MIHILDVYQKYITFSTIILFPDMAICFSLSWLDLDSWNFWVAYNSDDLFGIIHAQCSFRALYNMY